MRTRIRKTSIATMAFLLALSALATVNMPVMADGDDEPGTGPWAEDGSVFRDSVRQSADDPDADPVDWYRVNLTGGSSQVDMLRINVNLTQGPRPYLAFRKMYPNAYSPTLFLRYDGQHIGKVVTDRSASVSFRPLF